MNDNAEMQYSERTDLALEAKEIASRSLGDSIQGINVTSSEDRGITVTRMKVENEEGSKAIGKMIGNYITIEVPALRNKDSQLQDRVAATFAKEFEWFLNQVNITADAKVLIIGLGNWNVTPDALGPMVVENVMVTRHLFELMPDQVSPGYRQISAIAPGVLGITGIETSDIVQGIVNQSKPDLVIAIDALSSKALQRVNTTIQIADTGIHPGSGIGNKRKGINKETMGIPVIAIGVPTVVYASTIVNNSIELLLAHMKQQMNKAADIFGVLDQLNDDERLEFVKEVLGPLGHDLLVTTKEIDQFVEDIANVIANGLNASLHEAVDMDNVSAFTH